MSFSFFIPIVAGILSGVLVDYLAITIPYSRLFRRPVCIDCDNDYSFKDYLLFRRCPSCSNSTVVIRISLIAVYIISSLIIWNGNQTVNLVVLKLLVLIYFGVICVIDIRYHAIFLGMNIFGLLLCLYSGSLLFGIESSLKGGAAGSTIFILLYLFGIFVKKVRNAKSSSSEADDPVLGFADIILAGVLGLLVGWPNIFTMISWTVVLSGLFAGFFIIIKRIKLGAEEIYLPFAPFLIGGTIITFMIIL